MGADAESTKNGRPIDTKSVWMTKSAGDASHCGASGVMLSGKKTAAAIMSAIWSFDWFFAPRRLIEKCA